MMERSVTYERYVVCFQQMDEALMAKEAERAELMKQRQRIRVKLAGDKLAENELDLLR